MHALHEPLAPQPNVHGVLVTIIPPASQTTELDPWQAVDDGVHSLQSASAGLQPNTHGSVEVAKPSELHPTRSEPWHSVADGVHSLQPSGAVAVWQP